MISQRAKPVRVLIVDDSALVRQTLSDLLASDAGIEVIGTANDPFAAAERLKRQVPDVIVMDIEMPRMDGITFLRKIMAQRPLPVVICSSLVEPHSETLDRVLSAGAVEVICKPRMGTREFLEEARITICDVVKAASHAKLKQRPPRSPEPQAKLTADVVLAPPSKRPMARTTDQVVAIGASTGGTQALTEVLQRLPADTAGIVIVQHMPEGFTAQFSRRLDGLCAMSVEEARDGQRVLRGQILVAPGNRHLLLARSGANYHVEVRDGPLVSRHRPSVDVLFRSVANCAGRNALGIIMTGMGDDGARGMLEMREAGAHTIAQDEASCVVFGMPREAIKLGAAAEVVSLEKIPYAIAKLGR